jgi:hypothetical protein
MVYNKDTLYFVYVLIVFAIIVFMEFVVKFFSLCYFLYVFGDVDLV